MNYWTSIQERSLLRAGIFTFIILSLSVNLLAQHSTNLDPDVFQRFTFDEKLNYTEGLLSPAQFLGYELGEEYPPLSGCRLF